MGYSWFYLIHCFSEKRGWCVICVIWLLKIGCYWLLLHFSRELNNSGRKNLVLVTLYRKKARFNVVSFKRIVALFDRDICCNSFGRSTELDSKAPSLVLDGLNLWLYKFNKSQDRNAENWTWVSWMWSAIPTSVLTNLEKCSFLLGLEVAGKKLSTIESKTVQWRFTPMEIKLKYWA